jgi:NADH dehydrogenase
MRINIPRTDRKRVVIIGGGFAGLTLAQKLRKSNFQIVLIDKNNYHQFQPLFYQVATAGLEPSSIVYPLRKMFQKERDIFIRVTEVKEIKPETNQACTPLGDLRYDYLVLATGAETNFFGNEKIAANALPMKSVSEALFLRNTLFADLENALVSSDPTEKQALMDIVIVGGGPTGVEVAGALAEMKKHVLPKDYPELDTNEIDIHLIQGSPQLLDGMSDEASGAALKYLTDFGVKVRLKTLVTDYDGEYLTLSDGVRLAAKKVIWAAGVTGNPAAGLPKEVLAPGKRVKVNRFNQVEGFENIFAIGDIAFMAEEKYPKGHPQVAQVAIQQAENLAANLKNLASGKQMQPFSYKDKGSMATIGRNRAVVDLPYWKFHGAFAWFVWLFVHLLQLIGFKNRFFVFVNWVWSYWTYDQSLRLIIRPKSKTEEVLSEKKPAGEAIS